MTPAAMTKARFNRMIWAYYRKYGRHSMPWRHTRDPYAILVSEVMLQQTQANRVEGFYGDFMRRFPDFPSLAHATTKEVLAAWQGLGYNRRALSLRRTAEIVVRDFGGRLPGNRAALQALPGIGKGTSGSLMAFAFNRPEVFIETNVRRVFIHHFFPRAKQVTDDQIGRCIQRTMDTSRPREWYWALMDYSATMPRIAGNANLRSAHYRRQSPFSGSDRELRGKLIRYMLGGRERIAVSSLPAVLGAAGPRIAGIVDGLVREGFLIKKGTHISITT